MPKQYNLMDIPISKLNTIGKQQNFKNYIWRLVNRNDFNIIRCYTGYHTLEDLATFIHEHQLSSVRTNQDLNMWIKLMYSNWNKGLNNRLEMAQDFILVRNIIAEFIMDIRNEGKDNLNSTIEFVNSIDIDDVLQIVPESKMNFDDLDDVDEETFNDSDSETEYATSIDQVEKMCLTHSRNADRGFQKKQTKEEIKLQKLKEENDKKSKKLDGKILCVCGGYYDKTNKSKHLKTNIHQVYELKQQIVELQSK